MTQKRKGLQANWTIEAWKEMAKVMIVLHCGSAQYLLSHHWQLTENFLIFRSFSLFLMLSFPILSIFLLYSELWNLLWQWIEKEKNKTNVMLHSFCYLIKNLSLWISSFSPSLLNINNYILNFALYLPLSRFIRFSCNDVHFIFAS